MAVRAYVLINIEPGKTEDVVRLVRSVENVRFSFLVAGRYDMIASIEAKDMKDISDIVCSKIRSIQGISKTETLLVT
jgi:DNA-binding Lrp family transcriptional regulator